MAGRFTLGRVALLTGIVLMLAGAALPAFGAPPEYSLEGTCAVVMLHPDAVGQIAAETASVLSTASVSVDGTSTVVVSAVGPLDSAALGMGALLAALGGGVAVGRWARGHSW